MRLTHPLRTPYPWLTTLKVSQLQHIAQATGIHSSGPKAALLTRLRAQLPQCELPHPHPHPHSASASASANPSPGRNLSILSIDMGIRNLAYAHLSFHVPDTADSDSNSISNSISNTPAQLHAWRRLAVSELLPPDGLEGPDTARGIGSSSSSFSPAAYAHTAYALVTGLLARYAPTHVLIERQRFRSGGASAVQEWTLRVGVFEGMLYAVLVALRMGAGAGVGVGVGAAPVVVGVEPGRVGRYWEGEGSVEEKTTKKKEMGEGERRRKGPREGKKMKIDLVGGWLSSGTGSPVVVGAEGEVRQLVDAYLGRWEGKAKGKGRRKGKGEVGDGIGTVADAETVDVRKMDDLADCLVQGVTWLQWQTMRRRIAMMGLDALPELKK
ncbi:uncharacterized protein ACLA_046610 [Aspergillus clavatus NRRL 1]|uniref:SAP domain-containing protein n=1 Tax=Aspergillus clavatus (strain ATCC 1007 / CBS 513.65 / DSM 816 / NCTC 3887 / NRRL 1 / QM 1276 / 107) TaxID=344612 RepID=A1CH40_ASPCL|nr:uncharacterized protein ACLA_046610 [Aspergillus clavatus NRRL 1]EAW10195.1 conserved hypothetical protein [Aspergillus clavatus NRRL 1]